MSNNNQQMPLQPRSATGLASHAYTTDMYSAPAMDTSMTDSRRDTLTTSSPINSRMSTPVARPYGPMSSSGHLLSLNAPLASLDEHTNPNRGSQGLAPPALRKMSHSQTGTLKSMHSVKEESPEEGSVKFGMSFSECGHQRTGWFLLSQLAFIMYGLLLNAVASFVCGIVLINNGACSDSYKFIPLYLIVTGVLFLVIFGSYVSAMAFAEWMCVTVTQPRAIDVLFTTVLISVSNVAVGLSRFCAKNNEWLEICGLTSLLYCTICLVYRGIVGCYRSHLTRRQLRNRVIKCVTASTALLCVCFLIFMPGYPLYAAIYNLYNCPAQPVVSICLFFTSSLIVIYILYVVAVYVLKSRPYPVCSCTSREFTLPWLIISNLIVAGVTNMISCEHESWLSISIIVLAVVYAIIFLKVVPVVLNASAANPGTQAVTPTDYGNSKMINQSISHDGLVRSETSQPLLLPRQPSTLPP